MQAFEHFEVKMCKEGGELAEDYGQIQDYMGGNSSGNHCISDHN